MSRIVRFEEIDGELVLRVPADIAARLNFAAGDLVLITDHEKGLTVEPTDERVQRQLRRGLDIIEKNDAVLEALAK